MRNSAIILTVLLTATPMLAAEQCLEVEPAPGNGYVKNADTVRCFLRIDGKVIINRNCPIDISGNSRPQPGL